MSESGQPSRTLIGIAAAAVGLGVAQLVAVPFGPAADVRTAVGSAVINLTPGPVKEWAIQTFGTADKLFLSVAVLVVVAVIASITAGYETRRVPVGSIAIVAGGAAGCAAVLSRPGAGIADIVPTLVGTCCAVAVLRWLTRELAPAPDPVPASAAAEVPASTPASVPAEHDPGRRRSLVALGLLGLGAATGVGGLVWSRLLHSVSGDRAAFAVPPVTVPAPPIPAAVQPSGVALPSFITSNRDFYRIDTALSVPQLSRADWTLRIHGMVDKQITYDFAALQKFDVVEKVVTLTCVSNPVGGDLISNAKWTGYRVRDLLTPAGIHHDADMVLSMSIDGFTAGTPVEALTDGRDSLLAVTMNGEPLPVSHGYPARLVVPGLYGYVSATKWVVDLEVTRFDRAQAYWTGLGWSAHGPIKTESRIDVPRSGAQLPPGPTTFGGVAWAQNRGVAKVEVRIDDADWRTADLGASYSNDTWRLWSYQWDATPGPHTITVRATDNTGAVQTEEQAGVIPDGATGWDEVSFRVG